MRLTNEERALLMDLGVDFGGSAFARLRQEGYVTLSDIDLDWLYGVGEPTGAIFASEEDGRVMIVNRLLLPTYVQLTPQQLETLRELGNSYLRMRKNQELFLKTTTTTTTTTNGGGGGRRGGEEDEKAAAAAGRRLEEGNVVEQTYPAKRVSLDSAYNDSSDSAYSYSFGGATTGGGYDCFGWCCGGKPHQDNEHSSYQRMSDRDHTTTTHEHHSEIEMTARGMVWQTLQLLNGKNKTSKGRFWCCNGYGVVTVTVL
jgi:hypothetical protein